MVPLAPPPAVIARAIVADPQPAKAPPLLRLAEPRGTMPEPRPGMTFRDASMPQLSIENADLNHARFENVNLASSKIHNANLSDLEIGGAQLGGALFRHIGLPPKGTPAYVEGAEQRPLRFEECDLHGSAIKGSDLRGVSISGCQMQGMTIDGIPVTELLAAYREKHRVPAPAK
jgi:uncharacterized protein YjbI with pentapeptide repeats